MKSINTSARKFSENLVSSEQNLRLLQTTINGFNGQNIPNQIDIQVNQKSIANELKKAINAFSSNGPQLDLKINPTTLKKSVEDWINNNLGQGHFIKHIPLKLQEKPLKDSINTFLANSSKNIDLLKLEFDDKALLTSINNLKTKIPLQVDDQVLLDSIKKLNLNLPLQIDNKTLEASISNFTGEISLKLEWRPLRDSINAFLGKVSSGLITSVNDLPLKIDSTFLRDSINEFINAANKGKKGIQPLKFQSDMQSGDVAQKQLAVSESNKNTNFITVGLDAIVDSINASNALLTEIKKKVSAPPEISLGGLFGF